jgi:bacterioferritin (cytochrome b1)
MSENTGQTSWFGRLWRFTVRLVFVIVVGLLLGVGLYYGALSLYRNYVLSTQINPQRLSQLEARQAQDEQLNKQRMDDIVARLETLETLGDAQKAALAGTQARLATLEAAQGDQSTALSQIPNDMEALQGDLKTFQTSLDTLKANLDTLKSSQDGLQADVATLSQTITGNTEHLQALEAAWADFENPLAGLQWEVQLLEVMQLLIRGRLSLSQSNYGLAEQDIQTGLDRVLAMQSQAPADQVEAFTEIGTHLEKAVNNLPAKPVVAAGEMDGAWSLLIQMLPGGAQVEATATPTSTPAPTLQP